MSQDWKKHKYSPAYKSIKTNLFKIEVKMRICGLVEKYDFNIFRQNLSPENVAINFTLHAFAIFLIRIIVSYVRDIL